MAYTVTFNMMGHGTQIPSQTTDTIVTKPDDPIENGFDFKGWYTTSSYITLFDFNKDVSSNTTIYAKWTKVTIAKSSEVDWATSMQQTFEYYKIDPDTWQDCEKIDLIESCSIQRDLNSDTLGSASYECSESIDECYVRAYMIVNQNGIKTRHCLGTHLLQTPSYSFDGKRKKRTMDGYTSLIELKNDCPPIGYSLLENTNILDTVFAITGEHVRAPVNRITASKLLHDNFISNLDDTWFSFLSDLLSNADYRFGLDNQGKISFEPNVSYGALKPVWIYNDDNSSILMPEITDQGDIFDIPNVVEVIYSKESGYFYSRVENDDPDSPISTVNRGRVVLHRETDPSVSGTPSQSYIDSYAKNLLKNLSTLQHEVTYTHAYCPVRIGDGVMLNYKSAGLENVKGYVVSQTIDCKTGCTVEETAVYTTKLWG